MAMEKKKNEKNRTEKVEKQLDSEAIIKEAQSYLQEKNKKALSELFTDQEKLNDIIKLINEKPLDAAAKILAAQAKTQGIDKNTKAKIIEKIQIIRAALVEEKKNIAKKNSGEEKKEETKIEPVVEIKKSNENTTTKNPEIEKNSQVDGRSTSIPTPKNTATI